MALREAESGKSYIYSSTAKNQKQPKQILDAKTMSDEFVDKLANKPEEPNFNAALHPDDEWAKWLRVLDQNGQFTLTMAKDKVGIEHFGLAFQGPILLKFSTKKKALIEAFGDDASDISSPRYDAPLLCAGMVKPNDHPEAELELEKVWTFLGLPPETLHPALRSLMVSMDWSLPQRHRNALWFDPEFGSQITIRLVMRLASTDVLNAFVHSDLLKMRIAKSEVVSKKILTAADTGKERTPVNEADSLLGLECKLNGNLDLRGCMKFNGSLVDLTLQTDTTDAVAKLIAWLGAVIWGKDDKLKPMEDLLYQEPFDSKSVNFRRFQLTLDISGEKVKVFSFRVDVQAATSIGQSPKASDKTLFLFSYTWESMKGSSTLGTIRGELWEPSVTASLADPLYEEWTDFEPIPNNTPTPPIDIAYLIPGQEIKSIPATVPSKITRGFISLSTEQVNIGATIKTNKMEPGDAPQPYLGEFRLDASLTRGENKTFNFELYMMAGI